MRRRNFHHIACLLLMPLIALNFGAVAKAAETDAYLDVEDAFRFSSTVNHGKSIMLAWQIAEGYSLYKDKIKITSLTPGVGLSPVDLPEGVPKTDKRFGQVEVYLDELRLDLPLVRQAQSENRLKLSVTYQGCADDGLCFMPVNKEIALALPKAESSDTFDLSALLALLKTENLNLLAGQDQIAESIGGQPLAFIILSFLGFGLLLAFTPCVFPMIPIVSGIIAGQGGNITSRKAFLLSLSYVVASALTYMVFGILAGLFGANLQAFFQKPAAIAAFSTVFIVLALPMFGLFSLQMPAFIQTRLFSLGARRNGNSWLGAAVMGMFSSLAVGSCVTAPLAGALIYIGKTGDAMLGGLALFALGLGMGIPLLLVGTTAGRFLPKSGIWLEYTKVFFDMGLLAVAIWLPGRILPDTLTLQLCGLLLLIPLLYTGWKRLWKATAVMLLIYGGFLIVGVITEKERDYMEVLCNTAVACEAPGSLQFHKVKTAQELEQMLSKARQESRWVMLDIYADWCISCQEMKQATFADAQVTSALSAFKLVQADVTKNDTTAKALLKKLGIIGPPTVLFFGPDTVERKNHRIIGFVDSGQLLRRITALNSE